MPVSTFYIYPKILVKSKRQTPEKGFAPIRTISHGFLCSDIYAFIARLSKKSKNGDLGPLAYNKIK
jgi:hypothetical protein